MRTEQEIYDLILKYAYNDKRIKAVYMNGSRTNVNVPKDNYQDYDIVYVVEETESFIKDKEWPGRFGEIFYMQYPDENPYYPNDKANIYGWLMQFKDGVRIDLHVESVRHAIQHISDDKLCKILLDQDHILPSIEAATDRQYWVKKPTEKQYLAICNDFWWCTNNLVKGICREEMPYIQDMASHVRKLLIKVLNWKVGIQTDWSVSTGKSSKYLSKWLTDEEWKMFLETYFDGNISNAWKAVLRMCDLLKTTAKYVGEQLEFQYNEEEGEAALLYITKEYRRNIEGI